MTIYIDCSIGMELGLMSTWTAVLLAHRDDVQAAHSTQRLRSRSEVVGR